MIAYFKKIEIELYAKKTNLETALYSELITTVTREKKINDFIKFMNDNNQPINWLIDYTLRGTILYTTKYRGFEEEGKPKEY